MLARLLLSLSASALASAAMAQDLNIASDTVTTKANDLRGVIYAADGKVYVSGHRGDLEVETSTVLGRFNADGTPDASFGSEGFVEVDFAPGRIEQSVSVAEMANGDVVVAVNAADEDGGTSVYLLRFDSSGKQKTGADWGGDDGAVEVVFGWANADNAGYPDAEKPPVDAAWDVLVDTSSGTEKLVVAGSGSAPDGSGRTDADRYITRLIVADGRVDASFAGGKPFTYHSAQNFSDNGRRAVVEPDGAIVSAGYTALGDVLKNHVILVRLLPDGSPDPAFGGFIAPASSGETVGMTPAPGVAVFNPLVSDGGAAEAYAAVRLSDGSYVTAGYGAATAEGVASTTGFQTTVGPDVVTFKVAGQGLDGNWGQDGRQALQSEGKGMKSEEDRARQAVVLGGDRIVQVGRFGGVPAVFVLTKDGQIDTSVSGDGILELPNDSVDSQFFGASLSPDGARLALTTNNNKAGARLVILNTKN